MSLKLAILGCTGSIGTQALQVARMHPEEVQVVALAAGTRVEQAVAAAAEFGAGHLAFGSEAVRCATALTQLPEGCQVTFGAAAVDALVELPEVDMVLNALSGAAGLRASYNTLAAGKKLALANKESLVVGGELIMPLATPETLLPVDSEHSAIYQCLIGENAKEAKRIWLTASGGPFRNYTPAQLKTVTAAEALAHPTWNMGPKITIDSATLMNKGLEVIEAKHLFNMDVDDITVVVHPQSIVHSMVEYVDGSVKAHLGVPDMRIPIQYALSFPHRWESPAAELDFTQLGQLEFSEPDYEAFPCLGLALQAGREGGTLPCVMNAANEVANLAFREGRCPFEHIARCVERTMFHVSSVSVKSLEQLEEIDAQARKFASEYIGFLTL